MSGIKRELGFNCHVCTATVFVAVHCSVGGNVPNFRMNTYAKCDIRCPQCGSANRVIFDVRDGDVVEVGASSDVTANNFVPSFN